jgi:hypothetical protein
VQDDVFAVARAGIAPTSIYLSLIPHYQSETEYYVWSNIISNLSMLEHLYRLLRYILWVFYYMWVCFENVCLDMPPPQWRVRSETMC